MTSSVLLQTCFVSACANALLLRDSHPLNLHKAAVVARRTTRLTASSAHIPHSQHPSSHRHRRNCPTPVSPYRRRRTSCAAYYPDFLRKTSPHSFIALHKQAVKRIEAVRRAPPQSHDGADGTGRAMEEMMSLQSSLDGVMSQDARTLASAPHPHPQSLFNRRGGSRDDTEPRRFPEVVSLPLSQVDDLIDFETRSSRSASTASRSTNRLSLTLPIAPPNAFPSRPPASSTSLSFPPTPLDTPNVLSPTDPNDFITAIAAQERRVLELREELDRAESDLAKLKRSWATHEAYKKRGERQRQLAEPLRPIVTNPDLLDDDTPRKNVDIDRRRALLLAGQQSTPERTRRRVFTGRHTRTLSLLSPTKPTEGFSVHEDDPNDQKPNSDGDSPYVSRYAPITPAQLAKRASWAPRSTIPPSGVQGGVKQIAQDLKVGLWTFMEDLRQATVGEEPITGQGTYLRGVDGNMRPTIDGHSPSSHSVNQDTIRASSATGSRPRVTAAFDETAATSQDKEEPAPALPARPTAQLSRSKTETSKAAKRFSYTPLTVDAYDDNDECWSNWDSPSVSSPRWSGTTVNGDIITIPEKHDENDTPLKTKGSKSRLANRSPSPGSNTNKLEELLPPVLNRLTPANFKRTASDFMKEWEKSLSPPAPTTDLV